MVTMRTLPVVLDDAGAECDAKRSIPTRHARMPRQPLTGSGNGGEKNCRRWEIWPGRKLDEARGSSIGSSWDNQSGWHGGVAAYLELTFFSPTRTSEAVEKQLKR
jgi:hypothetical protein